MAWRRAGTADGAAQARACGSGSLQQRAQGRAGAEAAAILTTWLGGVTAFNAVVCVFVSILLYRALYKRFRTMMPL